MSGIIKDAFIDFSDTRYRICRARLPAAPLPSRKHGAGGTSITWKANHLQ
jgi:hypothetical protein